jgi:hypothetical protein
MAFLAAFRRELLVSCLGRHLSVGSANASSSSVTILVEAGVVTDDPGLFAERRRRRLKATPRGGTAGTPSRSGWRGGGFRVR